MAKRISRREFLNHAAATGLAAPAVPALVAASSGVLSVGTAAAAEELGALIPTLSIVSYATDSGPQYQQSARVLAETFKKLGLDVKLAPMQQSTMVKRIHVGGGLEDLALGSWGGDPDRLDPNFWINDLSACGSKRNAVKWCDKTYSELAQKQLRTLDEEKRLELVWQAQKYFHEHAPWWQVSHATVGILYNKSRWENVTNPAPVPPHETVVHPWLRIKPKSSDRILKWAHYEDVSTYNPIGELTSQGWIRFVYDSYLRFDGNKIVPWAAESWKVVDDTTLELRLRSGMTFHDGKPVTAEDAVFSFNLMVKHQPPVIADALRSIKGAERIDDMGFRLKLSEPNAAIFRHALTKLVILPKHVWEKIADPVAWDPIPDKGVIGSGPFVFESWSPNQVHVLRTHKKHWAAPAYDGIRRLSLGQADAIRAAMMDGSADIATAVLPAATMKELSESEDSLGFLTAQTINTTTVWVNHQKAPFNDLAFRKALRLATDRERVALEAWLGFAIPAGEGNVPIGLGKWHNADLEKIPFDVQKARQVLKEAGYGWDSSGRLHMPAKKG
ncbi:MAG TPA: ABC transporter substrate-binding protein [Xanthobacteraceae bacterium]|nr:ABC transporter substrate-binding protein [Xanthobacteraceae bacterium]